MRVLSVLVVSAVFLIASVGYSQDFHDEDTDQQFYTPDEADSEMEYDVGKTAAEYGLLDNFLSLLNSADMSQILKGEGPVTLFAPEDSAFDAMPEGELKKLKSNKDALRELLSRHIVVGKALVFNENETVSEVALSGDTLTIKATKENLKINNAVVIDEEIWCINGVIHILNDIIKTNKTEKEH